MLKILSLLTLTVLLHSVNAFAAETEIQMFVNYTGVNHYDFKIVSTPQMPTSAYYIYVGRGDEPTTAACYYGDPDQAIKLLKEMVQIFNAEYHHDLAIWGEVVPYPETGVPALHIEARERGHVYEWFDNMGPCVRAATEAEKHPTH